MPGQSCSKRQRTATVAASKAQSIPTAQILPAARPSALLNNMMQVKASLQEQLAEAEHELRTMELEYIAGSPWPRQVWLGVADHMRQAQLRPEQLQQISNRDDDTAVLDYLTENVRWLQQLSSGTGKNPASLSFREAMFSYGCESNSKREEDKEEEEISTAATTPTSI